MDPISILGLSLAGIAIGEAILGKMVSLARRKFLSPKPELVSSQVSNTT